MTVFAEILSSNQLLWHSLSSLQKYSEVVMMSKEAYYMVEWLYSIEIFHQKRVNCNNNTFFLSVVRIVALSWSCREEKGHIVTTSS